MIEEIRSHNLEKLSENELNSIDIKTIQRKDNSGFTEYVIKMVSGNDIIVQDLIDVRYYFEKDQLRNTDPNESCRMRSEVEILLVVTQKIMKML